MITYCNNPKNLCFGFEQNIVCKSAKNFIMLHIRLGNLGKNK